MIDNNNNEAGCAPLVFARGAYTAAATITEEMDTTADFTPLTSLIAPPSSSGGAGGATCLPPTSIQRPEPLPLADARYVVMNPHPPTGAVAGRMYPENTRLSAQPQQQQQQQTNVVPHDPAAAAASGGAFHPPASPHPRMAFGGGAELGQNPRLDPAGEVHTHIPRPQPGSQFASPGYSRNVYMQHQAELAEFHESKRRAVLYGRLFQSGLFPMVAALLFLLFCSAPAMEAVQRAFTPLGLSSDGGLTFAGRALHAALFGFVFSFAIYLL